VRARGGCHARCAQVDVGTARRWDLDGHHARTPGTPSSSVSQCENRLNSPGDGRGRLAPTPPAPSASPTPSAAAAAAAASGPCACVRVWGCRGGAHGRVLAMNAPAWRHPWRPRDWPTPCPMLARTHARTCPGRQCTVLHCALSTPLSSNDSRLASSLFEGRAGDVAAAITVQRATCICRQHGAAHATRLQNTHTHTQPHTQTHTHTHTAHTRTHTHALAPQHARHAARAASRVCKVGVGVGVKAEPHGVAGPHVPAIVNVNLMRARVCGVRVVWCVGGCVCRQAHTRLSVPLLGMRTQAHNAARGALLSPLCSS
jgi:hypothetical protein